MITLFCSAAASPGTTTCALAATLYHHSQALLVDLDRDPSQAVLAGWLGGCQPGGKGVIPLVQERSTKVDITRYTLPLDEQNHLFLPGFSSAASVQTFSSAWAAVARILQQVSLSGWTVNVDMGRVQAAGIPKPILEVSDRIMLVCRSALRSLVATRLVSQQLPSQHTGLVIVDPNNPYPDAEIASVLQLPVWASLPAAPQIAQVLSDGVPAGKHFARHQLVHAWEKLAAPSWQTERLA